MATQIKGMLKWVPLPICSVLGYITAHITKISILSIKRVEHFKYAIH